MTRFIHGHLLPAMLALLLLLVTITSGEQIRKWWSSYTPAIQWHGVEVANVGPLHPGDILELVYTARVNKWCAADLQTMIVAPNGSTPVRFPVVRGGYTKPADGLSLIKVSIVVPKQSDAGLAPFRSGTHIYRAFATRYCSDGIELDAATPDASFQLEVP